MNEFFKRLRLIAFIFFSLELITLIVFIIIFGLNSETFSEIFTGEVFFTILTIFVGVDLALVWTLFIGSSNIRHKSDLTAADLLGTDVQEAYNFGQIGLVVVDDNDFVLWTNDFFKYPHQIDLIDKNIKKVDPVWDEQISKLTTTIDAKGNASINETIKVSYGGFVYEVKYLVNAHLYIFKDITKAQTTSDALEDQRLVLGIIMIDNFSDVSNKDDDANDTISKVRNAIFEYAQKFNLLIRRYKNDAYMVICEYSNLEIVMKDEFSLLETVRKLGAGLATPPTLSIGLAYDENDVNKLNGMAEAAINIALSRGGDQVVVSRLNHDLVFYGGKSEAKEEKNKVGVRALGNSLYSTISNATNVFVMGHIDADMDALGSCLGILSICLHLGKECQIIYDKKRIEKKAREAFSIALVDDERKKWTIDPKDAIEKIKNKTLLVVVDAHRPSMTMCPKAIEKATKIVVIDHHRRSEEFIENPILTFLDSSASSACELVTELIHYTQCNPPINIPSKFATLMLSGIYMDTNFFKASSIGERTFEACMFLKSFNADNILANEWLKDEWAEHILITQILATQKFPYNGIIYCTANEDQIIEPATLAKVANQCLQIKDINACFVIGKVDEKTTRISCRSNGSVNVQLVAERLGGGGHLSSSAVTLPNVTIERASVLLMDTLSANFNSLNTGTAENAE